MNPKIQPNARRSNGPQRRKPTAKRLSGHALHVAIFVHAERELERRHRAAERAHARRVAAAKRDMIRRAHEALQAGNKADAAAELESVLALSQPARRFAGSWSEYACALAGPPLHGDCERLFAAWDGLVAAFRVARAAPDVWAEIVKACPTLADVDIDDPERHPLTHAAAKGIRFDPEERTLGYLLERFGAFSGGSIGYIAEPTHRDFALLAILAGYVSDAWRPKMLVSQAIDRVTTAVRNLRTRHGAGRHTKKPPLYGGEFARTRL